MRIITGISVVYAVMTSFSFVLAERPKDEKSEKPEMPALTIFSDAFKHGETIPVKYTCDGDDISPELTWSKPPDGTMELVLICDDPDAPVGTWDHWVVYGLPADTLGLPEGLPKTDEIDRGGLQGKNSWGKIGYGGPCPPRGPAHRYFFKLYALDKKLDLAPGADKKQIEKAIDGHILARAELIGKYGR